MKERYEIDYPCLNPKQVKEPKVNKRKKILKCKLKVLTIIKGKERKQIINIKNENRTSLQIPEIFKKINLKTIL